MKKLTVVLLFVKYLIPLFQQKRYLEITDEKTDLDLEILKLKANFKVRFVNVAKEIEIIDSAAKLFFPLAYCIFLFFYGFKCCNHIINIVQYREL